ncbi:thioredoxin family protein [Bacteroides sp. CG01]|uniref:TlpA family protein disulfide reductase n=1 Tax=Bacteroides sp. CG01 TaxID=3096000 RepID=UPI002AFF5414|nr:thioredoxin family protein [Bacteroides sp. CG01]
MKNSIIILLFANIVLLPLYSTNRVISLTLDNGNIFDSLSVQLNTSDNSYKFIGDKSDKKWLFSIPDSIIQQYYGITFHPSQIKDSVSIDLGFAAVSENDTTLYVSGTLYWNNTDTIELSGKFIEEVLYTYPTLMNRKIKTYKYIISSDDPEVALSINVACNYFGRFSSRSDIDYSYSQYLQNYITEIKKYPDSKSLMYGIYSGIRFYKNIADLEKVFNCFSEFNRQSYYGKEVGDYIRLFNSDFENMFLYNSITNMQEPVILKPNKPTIIIFSASWCKPCHKLIPILKNIYRKTSAKIDMVYISIDEDKTEQAWIDFLKKEDIPWRALSSKEKIKDVKHAYGISTIPQVLFVDKEDKVKKLQLTESKDVNMIYDYFEQLN